MNQLNKTQQVVVLAVCLIALVVSVAAQKIEKLEIEEIDEEGNFNKAAPQGIGHPAKGGSLGAGGINGFSSNFGNLGNRLNEFINKSGRKGAAPLNLARLEGSASVGNGAVVGAAPSATAAVVAAEERNVLGHHFHEFFELLLKPIELIKAIADHFLIPFEGFFKLVLKGMVFGVEVALSPLLVTFRIIEKVFVPDACRLRLMCQIGLRLKALKESVLLYTPHFLETSAHIKALSDGIVGRDCETTFIACEPKLKKPFEELKSGARGLDLGQAPSLAAEGTTSLTE